MKKLLVAAAIVLAATALNASALTWTSANVGTDENVLALYHFDEGVGTSTYDTTSKTAGFNIANEGAWKTGVSWGAGNNGYIDNVATMTKDANGNVTAFTTYAQSWNGGYSLATSKAAIRIDWSKSVTLSFWMKDSTRTVSENQAFYAGWNGWKDQQLEFGYQGGWETNFGDIRIDGVQPQEPTGHRLCISPDQRSTITDGAWHQIALVYDAANRTGSWYMDNALQAVLYQEGAATPWNFNYPATDENGDYVWNPTGTSYSTAGGLTSAVTQYWSLALGQDGTQDGRGKGAGIAIDELMLYQGVLTDFSNGFGATPAIEYPPGDFNKDGKVTDADYTIWSDNYQQPVPAEYLDGNTDGVFTDADYTLWAEHYGEGTGVVVPEPATLSLLGLGLLGLVRRRNA